MHIEEAKESFDSLEVMAKLLDYKYYFSGSPISTFVCHSFIIYGKPLKTCIDIFIDIEDSKIINFKLTKSDDLNNDNGGLTETFCLEKANPSREDFLDMISKTNELME